MLDGLGLWALIDTGSLSWLLANGLRLIFAFVGGVIGWYLTAPLFRLLFRLAFHRPAPGSAVFTARFIGALALGFILFLYSPGTGGSGFGFGWGDGLGLGKGAGPGNGDGKSDGQPKAKDGAITGKDKPEKKDPRPAAFAEVLRVEIVLSKNYLVGSDRWYLIQGKEPAKTLAEIEAFLKTNRDKFKEMDIVVYQNSVYPEHAAVQNLSAAAERHGLRPFVPRDYWEKKKTN